MKELTEIIDGKLCLSSIAMQEVFGVSRAALAKWAKQGCPKIKPGWWPLAEIIEWRGLGARNKPDDDSDLSDMQRKLKAEANWKEQQTEKLELENAVARGDYVAVTEVIKELSSYCVGLKKSLQSLSRKIATDVGPFVDPTSARRIERELSDMINDALETMSTGNAYVAPKRRVVKG